MTDSTNEERRETFDEFVTRLRDETLRETRREDYSDGLKFETWESAFESVVDRTEHELEEARKERDDARRMMDRVSEQLGRTSVQLTETHARADRLTNAQQEARAKLHDGKTVIGMADEVWREANPPKPDPYGRPGVVQERRMAFKGGFVTGWIACLDALATDEEDGS